MDEILKNATDAELARAIEANGVACCLSWAEWPGMVRWDGPYLTTTFTDVPFPFFNNVFKARIPEAEIDAAMEEVLATARSRKVPMFWWTGPTTKPVDLGRRLLENGFAHGFEAPAMAVELARMNESVEPPRDLTIREVTDEESLSDWCKVMTPAYEFPDFAEKPWLEMLASLGLGEDRLLRHFLGLLNDLPVASASLYLGCGVAGVSSVATIPEERRRGIGTAITLATLTEARRLGYHYGVLFSSPMGRGVYEKIGFREYGTGNCYVWSNE